MNTVFKRLIFLLLGLSIVIACSDESTNTSKSDNNNITRNQPSLRDLIQWVPWENWSAKEAAKDKKAIVYIHATNCTDCKTMDANVFENPIITQIINQHFYAAKLDKDEKKDIMAKGRVWKYKEADGRNHHELAAALATATLENKRFIPYPTVVFLDENFDVITPINKAINAKEMEMLLAYVMEEKYKVMTITQFEQTFKNKIQ